MTDASITLAKPSEGAQTKLFPAETARQPDSSVGQAYVRGQASIYFGPAEDRYADWPVPTCIVADGPYGVDGFPGDFRTAESLPDWYEPHIGAWSDRATPGTTLWFWNTEIGWATVHPLLEAQGWEYRCCNVWDKGLGHIAGNANTRTLRKFPVVTEVCVHYVKKASFAVGAGLSKSRGV